MTVIASPDNIPYAMSQRLSPQVQISNELQSLTDSGEISTEDQDALSGALQDISSGMGFPLADFASEPPSKEEVDAKIDSLISEQVESGSLTQEQADQLSALFDELGSSTEATDAGAPPPPPAGGPGGAGGPPPAGGSGSEEDEEEDDSVSSVTDVLSTFLQQLQEQNATGYSAAGNVTSEASLLFSYTA
ncbi:hypothetical protein [uncultured Cohaesibacter sp.]|uniref:hypothetical protein n=1 Tax=uncultured Cohaesibacter sp. TaxID=1002546 RepID=UPI0029C6C0E7|nr:hypothetical protein [uncultured Cohaesibacter sp.]